MEKLIFNFKSSFLKTKVNSKRILGGKGASLSEMGKLGLPVPPGFTISTKVCDLFYKNKKKLSKIITSLIKKEIHLIEKNTKKRNLNFFSIFEFISKAISKILFSCY